MRLLRLKSQIQKSGFNGSINNRTINLPLSFLLALVGLLNSASALSSEETFLTISVAGDTLLANSPSKAHPDRNLLEPVADLFKSTDFAFLNYEGTICDRDLKSHKCAGKKPGELCYAFRSPTQVVDHLVEAGINIVSLANNHIFDYGHACATDSKTSLEAKGIATVGLMDHPNPNPDDTISWLEHKGESILFLGFHYSDAWDRVISINQEDRIRALIRKHRDQAKLIIVSFHAGAEGIHTTGTPQGLETHRGENRGNSRKFAKLVIDEGADLVIGHGPHVLRGMETYKDRLIIYSLGNFSTYDLFKMDHPMEIGALVQVALDDQGRLINGKVHSTRQFYKTPGHRRGGVLLEMDPKGIAAKMIKELSQKDFTSYPMFNDEGDFTR